MYTRQANKMNFTFHEISPYTLSSTIELSLEFDVTDCHDQCVSSELSTAETNRKYDTLVPCVLDKYIHCWYLTATHRFSMYNRKYQYGFIPL